VRVSVQMIVLIMVLGSQMCLYKKPSASTATVSSLTVPSANSASTTNVAKVDFATQIKPMLEAKCRPCHFSGGTVYQRLPFDQPATIKTLGTKLFTRIKDENERALIRQFLSQQ
jgi:hypothetical protein